MIDTGSSNTWINYTSFKETSSTIITGLVANIDYGDSSTSETFLGIEVLDTVTLSPTLTIVNQSLGVGVPVGTQAGFTQFDGILGIGPTIRTLGNLHLDSASGPLYNHTVPTVVDNLFAQKKISSNSVAISFNPLTSTNPEKNGELSFGQVDPSRFTGEIQYAPIITRSPENYWYSIEQSMTYGTSRVPILTDGTGFLDTGSTLTFLSPGKIFNVTIV